MRLNYLKTCMKTAVFLTTVLLLGAGLAVAQQQVNLTAGPAAATLPDGSFVPMWGYSCDTTQPAGTTATCAKLNPAATGWSPVVITVPTGQTLQINLTNSLAFANGNSVPTSLVIVGQLGGGLGTGATATTSPTHNPQTLTWPAGSTSLADGSNTPPGQGQRVQSFSTQVAQGTTATALTWTTPRPGTYLLESGTHPSIQGPMGLYGMVVVTEAPSATAVAPATTTTGCAYTPVGDATNCVVPYNADVDLLFSEIDPVQNNSVATAVNTAGFSETAVWSGKPGGCGDVTPGAPQTCYPPAVNYSPRYFLINGVAFDKTQASSSLFPASPATGVTGTVLVRLVNAGLRMHVPSIVGSQTGTAVAPALPPAGFSLIAEDSNALPGLARVQSEVFMAPGKTYDVMVNVPAVGGTALPIYDRQGSVSGNAISRDTGMIAYLSVNGAGVPAAPILAAAAVANPDTYNSVVTGQTLTVSDPAKGLIANDVKVYGVQVSGAAPVGLVLNSNGTFTYTGAPTTFSYCANGTTTVCTTVALNAATVEAPTGIHVGPKTYTATVATSLTVKPSGVLSTTWSGVCSPTPTAPCHDYDAAGYPLTVNVASVAPSSGLTLTVNGDGSFTASVASPGTYTFTYQAQNSQGTVGTGTPATVTLVFPAASNLAVTVLDAQDKTTEITDYRWIIEEDRTFYVDPNCQANPVPAGCPVVTPQGAPAVFGTNFHTSYMPVVAQGCTGQQSCETGQTVLGVSSVCDVGNGVCRPGSLKTAVLPSTVGLDPTKRYYISVMPGDMITGDPVGHDMGGAQIVYVNG